MATSTVTPPFCTWLVAACMSSSDKDLPPMLHKSSRSWTRNRRLLAQCAAGEYHSRASSISAVCGSGFQGLITPFEPCNEFSGTLLFGSTSLELNRKQRRAANRAVHYGETMAVAVQPTEAVTSKKKPSTKQRRVVVTGLGVVSPVGHEPDIFYSNLLDGISGISEIETFDCAQFPTSFKNPNPKIITTQLSRSSPSANNFQILIVMASPRHPSETDRQAKAILVQPSSPRVYAQSGTPTFGAQRKIGIAVDLSDESAFAVKWAVQNYLRPGDVVILIHVRPTSVLYGADWGSVDHTVKETDEEGKKKLESDFDAFTTGKANDLAQPLVEEQIPFKIHIVKDHDMKERLCLEVERLGLSTLITGSRGFGATRRNSEGRLGSVSDYCVHHCVCPVVVVRFADEKDDDDVGGGLKVVAEEELEMYHDASDKEADAQDAP